MSRVLQNLIANFAGAAWSGFVTIAMVPVYVALLGGEAYGLIAFQFSVHVIAVLLDLGLGAAVNRELARATALGAGSERQAVVLRTVAVVYWLIAAAIGVILWAAAPLLAERWFTSRDLPAATIADALRLMGVAVAIRFPYTLYASALLGLQRHVVANAVLCFAATIRAGGAVAVVFLVAREVRVVFAWDIAAAALQTGFAAAAAWRFLPARKARFDRPILREAWAFARGIGAIGVLAAVATQVDKLVVSKYLPLRDFGYYSIAATAATVILTAVSPVALTIFPRFAELVAAGRVDALRIAYHRAAQVVSTVLLPSGLVAILFSREIVTLWTGDARLADAVAVPLMLLVAGAVLNGLWTVPYALQLAHGWTRPLLFTSAIAVVTIVPLSVFLVLRNGSVGAALAWLVMHAGQAIAIIVATHIRLMPGDLRGWLVRDVAIPAAAAAAVVLLGRAVMPEGPRLLHATSIAVILTAAMGAAGAATPVVREWLATGPWRNRGAQ